MRGCVITVMVVLFLWLTIIILKAIGFLLCGWLMVIFFPVILFISLGVLLSLGTYLIDKWEFREVRKKKKENE